MTKSESIEELLKRFDFEYVAAIMKAMNWTWYNQDMPPSIAEMKATCRRLLEKTGPGNIVSTGGFESYWLDNMLRLRFVPITFEVNLDWDEQQIDDYYQSIQELENQKDYEEFYEDLVDIMGSKEKISYDELLDELNRRRDQRNEEEEEDYE